MKVTERSEAELLQRAGVGDQAALDDLFARHRERLRWMGRLGEVYRILHDPRRAIPMLENALALAAELNATEYWVANALRLGTAIQHQERHEAADALFRAGLATSRMAAKST